MPEIKSILVAVSDEDASRPALDLGLQVGRRLGAHVQAMHVRTDPSNAVPLVGEGMSGVMVEEMINAAEQQATERAAAARALFDRRRAELDAPLSVAGAGESGGFSVAWREETGREEDLVARCARLHDLVVVGRPVPDNELPSVMTLNAALMEGGRPLLVAPPDAIEHFGRTIAVAWNGSAEAARAMGCAMQFLRQADQVLVLSAQDQSADPVLAPAEAAAYLARHGVSAEVRGFQSGSSHVGEALDAELRAVGADMLVMGAYTHSRLRQLILGGVTRHMLHHAAIPVFMTH